MDYRLEALYLLYSYADMMLNALLKPLIILTVRVTMTANSLVTSSSMSPYDVITTSTTPYDVIGTINAIINDFSAVLESSTTREVTVNTSAGVLHSFQGAEKHEDEVQKRMAAYLMADLLCVYIPGFVTGLYCGAWSDKHGRKPPLLLPPLGHVLGVLVYTLLLPHHQGSLLVLLVVAALLRGVMGKGAVFSMAVCSLLSDTQHGGQLSARFASLMASRCIGLCLGAFTAGVLQDTVGVVFGLWTSLVLQVICFFFIVFFVKETINASKDGINVTKRRIKGINVKNGYFDRVISKICCCTQKENEPEEAALVLTRSDSDESFTIAAAKEEGVPAVKHATEKEKRAEDILRWLDEGNEVDTSNYQTLEKEEDMADKTTRATEAGGEKMKAGQKKALVMIILVMSFIIQFLMSSQTEVIVLTTSAPPLSWPPSWYGYLFTAYFGAAGVGLLVLGPCQQRLLPPGSASSIAVLLVSLLCCAGSCVWTGLASVSPAGTWQIFAAYMLGAQGLMTNSALRSVASVIVSRQSAGKTMAALSVLENLAKVLGPLLHTAIYVASLPLHLPALVYYVLSGEVFLLLLLVLVIHRCLALVSS